MTAERSAHRAAGEHLAYLDYASTSPLRQEAAEAMSPFWGPRFGNPSGGHRMARDARTALEDAREEIAELLGSGPGEVIFTGGGTEADNLAVLGTLAARSESGGPGTLVCSSLEHPAVLQSCRAAARGISGGPPAELRVIGARPDGIVDLDELAGSLGPEVGLVSVMLANNEIGTIQPLEAVAGLVRDLAPDATLHTDAVQAAPWLDLAQTARAADLVTISAHKLGGPKGVGVLVAREGAALRPIVHGGGQERGGAAAPTTSRARSGWPPPSGRPHEAATPSASVSARCETAWWTGLWRCCPMSTETAPRERVLPGHGHLLFGGCEQEELLVLLDGEGVCASGGSACSSGALDPSPVLLAMGLPPAEARRSVRFTLGHSTTCRDVEHALEAVPRAVHRLRGWA